MKTSALLLAALAALALPASAANDGAAVYRPGLTQARIPLGSEWGYAYPDPGLPNLSSNLLALVDEGHADWVDRTIDIFKDGHTNDVAVNPISGLSWPWLIQESHGVFAYEGELWVEEGTNYYFYARTANGAAMVVDGKTVVFQGNMPAYNSAPVIRGFWMASKTGWVPFNVWFWSYNGTTGTQWSEWGAQYNVAGFSLDGFTGLDATSGIRDYSKNSHTNVWKRFVDPGNGTFLRTATTNRFTTATTADGRTWNLTFEGVPHAAQLVAFWGATDGIHDAAAWETHSTDPVDVPARDSSTTVSVVPGANATALRFRLAYANVASTNGLDDVFEEWTEVFPVSDAPVVRIDAVRPGFTNVVVSGELAALGRNGADAIVTIQIANAADESFADPISTNLPAASIAGPFEVLVQGVETNAAYLVRAIATATSCATSSVVSFRTARPTPAVATAEIVASKFFEANVAAEVSDWGAGATGAEVWIDVSASSNFPAGETQTISLGVLSGHLPRIEVGEVVGLEPDTAYFARVRLYNSWGLESESPSVALRTSSVPLNFSEPEASSENGWAKVSLSTNYVAAKTAYSVHLSAVSRGFTQSRNWSVPSDEPPFEWSVPASSGQSVHFRFEISWSNGDLSSGSDPIVIEADTTWTSEADYSMTLQDLDALRIHPGRPNLYLRPGEKVALITSTNNVIIDWHTNAVVSIDEKGILTALEPGATYLFENRKSDGQTNGVTCAVVVLPSGKPSGGVYIHKKLQFIPSDTPKHFAWEDPDEWEMPPGCEGPQEYPNAPGAYVYIVSREITRDEEHQDVDLVGTNTIGYLAVGQLGWVRHGFNTNGVAENTKTDLPWLFKTSNNAGGTLRFETGDGSPSWIRLLGHSHTTSRISFQVPIFMANDLEVDELNRVQDTAGWQNTRTRGLWFERSVDVGTNELRTVRSHPYRYRFSATWPKGSHAGGMEEPGWVSFRHDVLGSGTIRLEAATAVGLTGVLNGLHTASFTGTWDVANGDLDPRINHQYGSAGLNLYGLSLGNSKEMIIRGSWHRAEKTWPRGALVRTGFHNPNRYNDNGDKRFAWTNDWQNGLPGIITLDGGNLQIHPQGEMTGTIKTIADNTGIRLDAFRIGDFHIPAGPMSRLEIQIKDSTSWPNVRTEITNLYLDPTSVSSFDLHSSTTKASNEFFIVNPPAGGWVPKDEAESQFLPFFFANNQIEGGTNVGNNPTIEEMGFTTTDNTKLAFRDRTTGKVVLTNTVDVGGGYKRWTAGETLANNDSYFSMQLASNVTNAFEEGATVQNLAGYVDMRKGAALGRPGEDAGATVDFGDQPARIFNGNWDETGMIGCRLAGTAGLVTGGNGTIALAASAEGVAGGVRVAGGTLDLGAVDGSGKLHPGRVSGDVRVEAGSRLVVRDKRSFAPGVRLFLNDRDWIPSYAHVRMEGDASAARLFVCGEPMPNGYYGSSEAALARPDIIVDDIHFEGPGVLWAGVRPTMMIFR